MSRNPRRPVQQPNELVHEETVLEGVAQQPRADTGFLPTSLGPSSTVLPPAFQAAEVTSPGTLHQAGGPQPQVPPEPVAQRRPAVGLSVLYRGGGRGVRRPLPAIITGTVDTQPDSGVRRDRRLSSDTHVHLHVFSPDVDSHYQKLDVPFNGDGGPGWDWPTIT